MADRWEAAFREADTTEKRAWLWEQARLRDQLHEASCGLLAATYPEATNVPPQVVAAAEAGLREAVAVSTAEFTDDDIGGTE